MNILFLEGDLSRRGGTERMCAWLASALSQNHRVSVLSLRLDNSHIPFPLAEDVHHTVLASTKTAAQIREIHRFIRENAVDTIINVDTGMGYIGILASFGTRAKVITWEHSNFFNNWDSRVFPHLRRFAARHSRAMVVLTERDRKNYESNIARCAPVTVIANPARRVAGRYDIASKTILSAGLLGKIKRFDLAVPIGKTVFARHPDWRWVICGDGPERAKLEQAVRDAGLQDHILFAGAVSDMDAEYAKAALYVLTSGMEGLPMVLLEAKSHSLPIVSFDIETGPSDIVRDGVNGYLVVPGDTDAMAGRICRLIEDRALREDFSKNTVLDMERFDEWRILTEWEQLIQSL